MADHVDLWQQFQLKLRASGADPSDIDGCTPDVLQRIASELGFTALQCGKLQTEWARRRGGQAALLSSHHSSAYGQQSVSASPAAHHHASHSHHPSPTNSVRIPVAENSAEYLEVAAMASETLLLSSRLRGAHSSNNASAVQVLGIERVSSPVMDLAFNDRRTRLCNSGTIPVRKARLVPMESAESVCREGFISLPESCDILCPCGLTLFSEIDIEAFTKRCPSGSFRLTLCDVTLGNTKLMAEEDVARLGAFPTDRVLRSLSEDGFDSIQVQRRASPHSEIAEPDAFVVFHPHQLICRYLVTFTCPSSLGGNADVLRKGAGGAMTTASPTPATALCSRHGGRPFEFYCIEEQKLVCSHCMYLEGYANSGRRCVLIDDAAKRETPWLRQWVANAEQLNSDVGRMMGTFDAAMDQTEADGEKELAKAKEAVAQLKEQLDDYYAQLEEEVGRSVKEQTLSLQKSLSHIVELQSRVEDVMRPAKIALATNNSLEILAARQAAGEEWAPVNVPEHVMPTIEIHVEESKAMLRNAFRVVHRPSDIELPELIDANHLREDIHVEGDG